MVHRQGPTRASSFVFGLGLGALGVAFIAALCSVAFDGKPDDVVLDLGGHVIGGPTAASSARVIALVAGTAGVACVLRTWKEVWSTAPRDSREHP